MPTMITMRSKLFIQSRGWFRSRSSWMRFSIWNPHPWLTVKTSASMEGHMQAPSGNRTVRHSLAARLDALGLTLPAPPTPLGAYVEASAFGNLLFLSGILPVRHGKLEVSGRFGQELSIKDGQEAARLAALNA